MRRLILCGCAGLLLLCGCARKSELPPEDVLKRAAAASDALQSASFIVRAQVTGPKKAWDAKADVRGVLQDGGRSSRFDLTANGSLPAQDGPHAFRVKGEAVVEWGRDLYFRLDEAVSNPPHPLLPAAALAQLTGPWWRVPSAQESAAPAVTTDPRLLNAQAQIVRVIRDRGIQRIRGAEAYRYDVTIDPERLAAYLQRVAEGNGEPFDREATLREMGMYDAVGELWIDAHTYVVHSLSWDIHQRAGDGLHLELTADLSDHNEAPPVHLPADARPFPRGNILEAITAPGGLQGGTMAPTNEEMSIMDILSANDPPSASGSVALPLNADPQ